MDYILKIGKNIVWWSQEILDKFQYQDKVIFKGTYEECKKYVDQNIEK